ncbi:phage capsid protein [Rhodoferax fermentans]|uniref:Hydrolase or metal-binding protein n=1 Tax=Rhodoferax fermentans TaxID=28066 RepID=A0A1T1AMZ1_RHOFE|nr:phage capsid protein [Rhodoferax fermentans]OOV05387.1 hypothetical protein RF819_00510 [Rhodoferax fermentans]
MLKGLALTPPIIGRISIGKVVEKAGKRLPEKDDGFTLTSQVQSRDGGWVNHPLDEALRKVAGNGTGAGTKLRHIPIRLLFDDPDLNLRASYHLFDRQTGRPMCVGNGETCRRSLAAGVQTLPCPSPEACELAKGGYCKPYGRLNVRVVVDQQKKHNHSQDQDKNQDQDQDQDQDPAQAEDELGSFIFRTTGFNSIRTLSARLRYFQAISGGMLSTLPLELRLRGKSTTKSHRAAIYYVDLTIRTGMTLADALTYAKTERELRQNAGFDQVALDAAARLGFAAGAFEESEEEGAAVVEEFYPDEFGSPEAGSAEEGADKESARLSPNGLKPGLADKLNRKVALMTDLGKPVAVEQLSGSSQPSQPPRPSQPTGPAQHGSH